MIPRDWRDVLRTAWSLRHAGGDLNQRVHICPLGDWTDTETGIADPGSATRCQVE